MSSIDDGVVNNSSDNETFEQVLAARLSRRQIVGGGAAAAALASLGGISSLLTALPAEARNGRPRPPMLGFQGIATSTADAVVVPQGYTAEVLIAWGDPISDGPEFKDDASNSAYHQAWQWGMHNDGVVFFPFRGSSSHGLLVQNNEYTDDVLLFPDGAANWNQEKTNKSINAHGVSIVEVRKEGRRRPGKWHKWHRRGRCGVKGGEWEVVRPSQYARRITGMTPMRIGGPATGDSRLETSADPQGRHVLGTLNNCAMGFTPWGTYLACEENFNGYFRKVATSDNPLTAMERRYGIGASPVNAWYTTDKRFDTNQEPNEPNRFGWVVEIDPFDPGSTPVKRTGLGRLKHEGAWVQEARDGRVVVYMGDDQANEYIYRYVSRLPWRKARKLGINPLDDGTLYVGKFYAEYGEWLPLTPENPLLAGWSLNDILIDTRTAADRVGATKMDRPEWIDTFPETLTAIATLTNNSGRGGTGTNPPTDPANPRASNVYGHIIKWYYRKDFTEPTFGWDIFALCGDPGNAAHGSTIVGDKYGSPDGIYVAPSGRLWIQTDVSSSTINAGAYAGFGNNQMLCADVESGETRRFLVGPNGCEITGVFVTPDERTMFVGIQHPGEAPSGANDPANPKQFSSWPEGAEGGRPRSACIVITKDDGGEIGS
ncbi:MAG TPA: PhoX family phosphatase [Steroidobacteraceae bacterium]|nr:PhoX family phosphatase [Steroidobacteraceae bacterium]